jgi:hypothetical protein
MSGEAFGDLLFQAEGSHGFRFGRGFVQCM